MTENITKITWAVSIDKNTEISPGHGGIPGERKLKVRLPRGKGRLIVGNITDFADTCKYMYVYT